MRRTRAAAPLVGAALLLFALVAVAPVAALNSDGGERYGRCAATNSPYTVELAKSNHRQGKYCWTITWDEDACTKRRCCGDTPDKFVLRNLAPSCAANTGKGQYDKSSTTAAVKLGVKKLGAFTVSASLPEAFPGETVLVVPLPATVRQAAASRRGARLCMTLSGTCDRLHELLGLGDEEDPEAAWEAALLDKDTQCCSKFDAIETPDKDDPPPSPRPSPPSPVDPTLLLITFDEASTELGDVNRNGLAVPTTFYPGYNVAGFTFVSCSEVPGACAPGSRYAARVANGTVGRISRTDRRAFDLASLWIYAPGRISISCSEPVDLPSGTPARRLTYNKTVDDGLLGHRRCTELKLFTDNGSVMFVDDIRLENSGAATFPDPITITFGEVDPDLGGADRTGLPHTSGSAGFTFFGFNYAKCSAVKQVGAEKGLPGLESFCNDTWALVSQPDTFARGVARYDFWTFDMTSIRIGSAPQDSPYDQPHTISLTCFDGMGQEAGMFNIFMPDNNGRTVTVGMYGCGGVYFEPSIATDFWIDDVTFENGNPRPPM